jgi:hypothetical protein
MSIVNSRDLDELCFTLTLVINQREGAVEIEFVSSSYGRAGETG